MILCPLCLYNKTTSLHEETDRPFLHCPECDLIFVPKKFHLSPEEEKKRYDTHENDPDDPAYRNFLRRLMDPLVERLHKGASGLDYGAGPGPTLSVMLTEHGFDMKIFDPFYANDEGVLNNKYDFVTCTETAEHFTDPNKDWKLLANTLKAGGWLGIMTQQLDNKDDFPNWYYKKDPTHVCFYSYETFQYISKMYGFEISFHNSSVLLMRKTK